MNAQDLRIGNYVYRTNKQTKEKLLIEVTPSCIMDIHSNGENSSFIYEPIPLTEEWFLKCKSNSIFNNGFEYKKTSTGRFEIYAGTILITVIEFVHELQNLNFALLGEDVIIENY